GPKSLFCCLGGPARYSAAVWRRRRFRPETRRGILFMAATTDGIKVGLKLLTKADRETNKALRQLAALFGIGPETSPLLEFRFEAGGKRYRGLLTAPQKDAVLAARTSVVKVQRVLLNLLARLNLSAQDAEQRLRKALEGKSVPKVAASPVRGACD